MDPTRLQYLSQQFADKAAQFVENNERLLDTRTGGYGYKYDQKQQKDGQNQPYRQFTQQGGNQQNQRKNKKMGGGNKNQGNERNDRKYDQKQQNRNRGANVESNQ